jgi:hypothetical protein
VMRVVEEMSMENADQSSPGGERLRTAAQRRAIMRELNPLFGEEKRRAVQRALEESVRNARSNGCGADVAFEVAVTCHGVTKRGSFTLCEVGLCQSIFDEDDLCVLCYRVQARRGGRGRKPSAAPQGDGGAANL